MALYGGWQIDGFSFDRLSTGGIKCTLNSFRFFEF